MRNIDFGFAIGLNFSGEEKPPENRGAFIKQNLIR